MNAYYAMFIPRDKDISVVFLNVGGCATYGDTMERALAIDQEALEGHMEAMLDDNDPLPKSSTYARAWQKAKDWFAENGEDLPRAMSSSLSL